MKKYQLEWWSLVAVVTAALLTILSCVSLGLVLGQDVADVLPTMQVGSHALGDKKRYKNACLAQHGFCTPLTLCRAGSVHIDPKTGETMAGHQLQLCPHMHDVCCLPDPQLVRHFRAKYADRLLQLANERAFIEAGLHVDEPSTVAMQPKVPRKLIILEGAP